MSMDSTNISSKLLFPTTEGVKALLASPWIKGIGEVLAGRIVEKTGLEILNPDFNFDESLSDIKGLNGDKIQSLKESFKALKYSPELLAFLYGCRLNDTDIEKILSHYKKHTAEVIMEDPYQMVEDVFKLSFFTADKIGKVLGIASDDPRRLQGALLTAIRFYAEDGSMFATPEQAVITAARITGAEPDKVKREIRNLAAEERIIESHGGLYLPVYFKAEKEGAEKLAGLILSKRDREEDITVPTYDRGGNLLSEEQKEAIKTVVNNPVTVITGGPGTGKTTTIRGIIKLLEDLDKEVVLAAPTGRAAKRMSDLSGREAKTLHRLLGYTQGRGYKNKKLKGDILIIDEASMLEQVMFHHLLEALTSATKIVLVGDPDQLPAIGAGDVLKEMIKSGTVPVVRLNHNFRQHNGSLIAANANAIKKGETPATGGHGDFMMISEETPKRIHNRLINLVTEELPEKCHIPPRDIQVVTPQQEGPLGAKQLNIELQEAVNPSGLEVKHGVKRFRIGDRVMQTSNSSERNTFNGETGWISSANPQEGWVEVTFYDGKVSRYYKKDLKELSLAYATTVHKLQGSETDYMVMPMSLSHKPMLYRNLLYTGVSRAKKMCVLVGEEKALRQAVETTSPNHRNSNFNNLLRENLPVKYEAFNN